VAQPGAPLTFGNADVVSHNVVSTDFGPDTPACAAAGFALGQCPVFWSPTIPAGQTAVNGTENLVAGRTYAFYCAAHPVSMRGTLTASG
jgi:plastocyanin